MDKSAQFLLKARNFDWFPTFLVLLLVTVMHVKLKSPLGDAIRIFVVLSQCTIGIEAKVEPIAKFILGVAVLQRDGGFGGSHIISTTNGHDHDEYGKIEEDC